MGRGVAWFDTGTHESLLNASLFVQALEERQGLMVGCLEEIAFHQGFIGQDNLKQLANSLGKSSYGKYLHKIADAASESGADIHFITGEPELVSDVNSKRKAS